MMEEPVKKRGIVAVGDLEVDLDARRVSREGDEIRLGRLSFDLLKVLVEAAPVALSTDDLVERVWGGDAISDETVQQRVSLLRRALGREPKRDYIETLRGFGYRLAVEPRPLDPLPSAAIPPRNRFARAARALILTLVVIALILVLTLLAIGLRKLKRASLGGPGAPSVSAVAAHEVAGTTGAALSVGRLPSAAAAEAISSRRRPYAEPANADSDLHIAFGGAALSLVPLENWPSSDCGRHSPAEKDPRRRS